MIPAEVREAAGIEAGTPMTLLPTDAGLVLMTRNQLKARVRSQLAGEDLVGVLLAERRSAAKAEGDPQRETKPSTRSSQTWDAVT